MPFVLTLGRRLAIANSLLNPWYVLFVLTQYILLNLGVSKNFGTVWWKELSPHWPFEMVVDWVRVYQPPNAINVGCDPKDYPTQAYINQYIEACECFLSFL